MPINITKALNEIQSRLDDSTQTGTDLNRLISIASRANNSGINALTYRSTGHLPSTADSNYIGFMAYVASDNVFGDSSGRFYYASNRDSGWIPFTTSQDSDESLITIPTSSAPAFAGENYGFSMGGGSSPYTQKVEAYSFASDGNSTDVGSFSNPDANAVWSGMGGGTTTKGYHFGGSPLTPAAAHVYEFTYAAGTPVTTADAGFDISPAFWRYGHYEMLGNRTEMYVAGGYRSPATNTNVILKMPEASPSTKTDVGDLTSARRLQASASSDNHGYIHGGYTSANVNIIDKWPWTTDENATDVGDLHTATRGQGGHSSSTHGYASGGNSPPAVNQIQKFTFATDGNATDAADLNVAVYHQSATSSDVSGYSAGGTSGPAAGKVDIQKFSFSADTNATDVGDLTFARQQNAGTHY